MAIKGAYQTMNNEFISSAELYTDLAAERRRADTDIPGVEYRRDRAGVGSWERIKISSEEGAKSIGRPIGRYDTLNLRRMDELTEDEIDDAKEEIAKELCFICDFDGIFPDRILVVGLGNRELTPDAVGAECAAAVEATRHIYNCDPKTFYELDCSEISVLIPGVSSNSGIDTADIVEGIARRIAPSVIFAIDALASGSTERLGATVQISNTGIFPGSGLGRGRKPINQKTTGVSVIAIGVPTVINSRLITKDQNSSEPELFVSPKDVHLIVKNAAKIIGGGINQAFGF